MSARQQPLDGTLIDRLTVAVVQAEDRNINLIDGERCMHEIAYNEESQQRLVCSARTDLVCDGCGEIYCPRHMHLHKRWYCMGVLVGRSVRA